MQTDGHRSCTSRRHCSTGSYRMAWQLHPAAGCLPSLAPEERLTPEEISAASSVVTALVALVALIATVPQYRQAKRDGAAQIEEQRRLARDEARPYVAVTMQFAEVAPAHLVHFVIRNYGHTSARQVRVVSDPPLRRAQDLPGATAEVFIPDSFPTHGPWSVLGDVLGHGAVAARVDVARPARRGGDLHDDTGAPYEDRYVLDWGVLWKQRQNPPKTMHDAASALVGGCPGTAPQSPGGTSDCVVSYGRAATTTPSGYTPPTCERRWPTDFPRGAENGDTMNDLPEGSDAFDPSPTPQQHHQPSQGMSGWQKFWLVFGVLFVVGLIMPDDPSSSSSDTGDYTSDSSDYTSDNPARQRCLDGLANVDS